MRCEYCGSILKEDALTDGCPNCGAVAPVVKAAQRRTAVVGKMPDEEKRKMLRQSGCRYCPHCLSTNISQNGVFSGVRDILWFAYVSVLAGIMSGWLKLFWLVPVLMLLYRWILSSKLYCADCQLDWFPPQAKVYEKYRWQLHSSLGDQPAVQCPGINGQTIIMHIDRVTISHPPKQTNHIRYDKLADVVHREAAGDLFGSLTVREQGRDRIPIPQTYDAAQKDSLTILYDPQYTEHYRTMYASLKSIADKNRKNAIKG